MITARPTFWPLSLSNASELILTASITDAATCFPSITVATLGFLSLKGLRAI
ncbi:hypothetical protein RvVAR031_09420 [Agrobacterium vitis]|nr:hypothetical protein RvVAR031_09420 [Agrobacterium vitis]